MPSSLFIYQWNRRGDYLFASGLTLNGKTYIMRFNDMNKSHVCLCGWCTIDLSYYDTKTDGRVMLITFESKPFMQYNPRESYMVRLIGSETRM